MRPAPEPSSTLQSAWQIHRGWSEAADRIKAEITRARTASLVLLVSAAVFGAVTAQDQDWVSDATWQRFWGIAAAVSLAGAGAIETLYATPARTRGWTSARQASERLKAAVWLYLCEAPPFHRDTEAERDAQLFELVEDVERRASAEATRSDPVSLRELPKVRPNHLAEDYVAGRAQGQLNWHRENGALERKRGRRLKSAVAVLTAIGAVLAGLGGVFETARLATWIAAFSAATAALTTHAGSVQHEQVSFSYLNTASRIELAMQRQRTHGSSPETDRQLVVEVEQILAVQNDIWGQVIDQ